LELPALIAPDKELAELLEEVHGSANLKETVQTLR